MSDIYKLQYNGMTLAYPGWNGYVSYEAAPAFKTLTLCASNGGTLTADTITGMPGDTIELAPTYDTYWRLSGYEVYGDGSVSDNTYTFGNDDEQIVSAYFKPNAFTATGNFDKGSDIVCRKSGNGTTNTNVSEKYALHVSHTGDVPASWYSTSNRWNPSNASAYKISLTAKMTFTASGDYQTRAPSYCTATTVVGSTNNQNQSYSFNSNSQIAPVTFTYSKTVTSTTQSTYGVSAHLQANGYRVNSVDRTSIMTYKATGTTGTWSATGYAP